MKVIRFNKNTFNCHKKNHTTYSTFNHVSPVWDVFTSLFIGNFHSLLGRHNWYFLLSKGSPINSLSNPAWKSELKLVQLDPKFCSAESIYCYSCGIGQPNHDNSLFQCSIVIESRNSRHLILRSVQYISTHNAMWLRAHNSYFQISKTLFFNFNHLFL